MSDFESKLGQETLKLGAAALQDSAHTLARAAWILEGYVAEHPLEAVKDAAGVVTFGWGAYTFVKQRQAEGYNPQKMNLPDKIDFVQNRSLTVNQQEQILKKEQDPSVLKAFAANESAGPKIQRRLPSKADDMTHAEASEFLQAMASRKKLEPASQIELLSKTGELPEQQAAEVLKTLLPRLAPEVQLQFLKQVDRLHPAQREPLLTALASQSGIREGTQLELLEPHRWNWAAREALAANPRIYYKAQEKLLSQTMRQGMDMDAVLIESRRIVKNLAANEHLVGTLQAQMVRILEIAPQFKEAVLEGARANDYFDFNLRKKLGLPPVKVEFGTTWRPPNFYSGDRIPGRNRYASLPEASVVDRNPELSLELKDVHLPEKTGLPPLQPSMEAHIASAEVSLFGRAAKVIAPVAKFIAPVGLAALPVIEGVADGCEEYRKGGSALETTESALGGLGKGILDTYLPSARNYYSDVTGGKRTGFDRFLNAASDATATGFAIGATATVVETAGMISIPATIPTVIATGVAGLSNFGINAIKGVIKVTGLAGRDQDGGYIYDGAKLAIDGVEHLLGVSAKE
jgi:hypothetical protein